MDHHLNSLSEYISDQILQGKQTGHIRQELLAAGWDPSHVDHVMHNLASGSHHPPSHAATPHNQHGQSHPENHHHTGATEQHAPHHTDAGHHGYDDVHDVQGYAPAFGEQPQKYAVFQSISETLEAIQNNFKNIAISTLVLFALLAGTIGVSFFFIFSWMFAAFQSDDPTSGIFALGSAMIVYLAAALFLVIVQVFGFNLYAMTLMDGANRQTRSFGAIFRPALKQVWRTLGAVMLVGLLAVVPQIILAVAAISYTVATAPTSVDASLMAMLGIGIAISIVWYVLVLFRFALAPIVTIFEPETKVTRSLSRSKQLLVGGGQWFLFKAILLGFAFAMLLGLVMVMIETDSPTLGDIVARSLITAIFDLFLALCSVGCLVMLYRNRVVVRGQQQ